MNSLDDLRDSLDRHADLAPDGLGLVEQAQTGAARVRRRRRVVGAAVAAAAVLLVVAAAPALVQSRRPAPQVAASVDDRPATRFTLGVAAGSGVTLSGLMSNDTMQLAAVRVAPAGPAGQRPAPSGLPEVVMVYDPGAFDPTTLRRGTPTTVGGQPAWLHADYPVGSSTGRATALGRPTQALLGWRDPSGVWITVGPGALHLAGNGTVAEQTRTTLHTIAAAVRIGPVRDVPMPYRLGWLPPGVRIDALRPRPDGENPESRVELGGTRTSVSTESEGSAVAPVQISIETIPTTSPPWRGWRDAVGGIRTTVAGHPAWYHPLGNPAAPSTLAVEIGTCGFMINVWRDRISFADQQRMVAAMTVVDCAKPATWIPLVR